MRSAQQHLAALADRDLAPGYGGADSAGADGISRAHGRDATALGDPIHFSQRNSQRAIPAHEFRRNGGGADESQAQAIEPNCGADGADDERVGGPSQGAVRSGLSHRPSVELALHPGGARRADADGGVELLPDAWDGEHHRGSNLAQVLRNRLGTFDKVADGACKQCDVEAEDAFGDQAERQETEAFIVRGLAGQLRNPLDLGHQIGVAERDQARRLRGARGGCEHGDVRRGNRHDGGVPGRGVTIVDRRTARTERGQAFAERIGEFAQALHIHDDDTGERGATVADVQNLVELLFVFHEQDPAAGCRKGLGGCVGIIAGCEAEGDAAGGLDRKVDGDPVRPGLTEDAGDFALPQPEFNQRGADGAHPTAELRPRNRLPNAAIFLSQDSDRTTRRHAAPDHRRNGGGVVHRHSFFFFQRLAPRTPASFCPR